MAPSCQRQYQKDGLRPETRREFQSVAVLQHHKVAGNWLAARPEEDGEALPLAGYLAVCGRAEDVGGWEILILFGVEMDCGRRLGKVSCRRHWSFDGHRLGDGELRMLQLPDQRTKESSMPEFLTRLVVHLGTSWY